MIELKNVSKSFSTPQGVRNVLSDFSLTVGDGVFLGIKGESGAGKSTLVSIIAGLQKADIGEVLVNGKDISSMGDEEISRFRNEEIGFVSQEQSFLENMTVLENAALPFFLGRRRKGGGDEAVARARALLDEFGIGHLSEISPASISGGENRRLLIARALMNDPEIIIADEPTDAVSRKQAEEIISIFRQLSRRGKTVILVTHDEDSLGMCDEVFYLS